MSVKNRNYEVCICWLRGKDARTHSARQQKYTKTEQVEYEGKERGKEKVQGAMSYAHPLE